MSDMFGHHSAENNLEKAFYNLLLLVDHYSGSNVSCSNCIVKHLSDVIAYVEEASSLDNAEKYDAISEEAVAVMNKHLKIVLQCTKGGKCDIKSPHDIMKMIQEARHLRRKIGIILYGVDSDVASDNASDHEFTKSLDRAHEYGHISHSHAHSHAHHTKLLHEDIGDDLMPEDSHGIELMDYALASDHHE